MEGLRDESRLREREREHFSSDIKRGEGLRDKSRLRDTERERENCSLGFIHLRYTFHPWLEEHL